MEYPKNREQFIRQATSSASSLAGLRYSHELQLPESVEKSLEDISHSVNSLGYESGNRINLDELNALLKQSDLAVYEKKLSELEALLVSNDFPDVVVEMFNDSIRQIKALIEDSKQSMEIKQLVKLLTQSQKEELVKQLVENDDLFVHVESKAETFNVEDVYQNTCNVNGDMTILLVDTVEEK